MDKWIHPTGAIGNNRRRYKNLRQFWIMLLGILVTLPLIPIPAATNAIDDGFLIVGKRMGSSKKARGKKRYRLPLLADVSVSIYDFYCYECHLPGVMEHYRECTRSFHRLCCRKNLWLAIYMRSGSQEQRNVSSFASLTDSTTNPDREIDVRVSSSRPDYKSIKNRLNITEKYNASNKNN